MNRLDARRTADARALESVDAAIERQAQYREDWPALIPLDAPDLPRLAVESLPAWAGTFARSLSLATETPRELAVAMVLSTCATAAARRLQVRVHDGYFETCNLWLACALPPGNRKSAVQMSAASPLIAWEHDEANRLAPEIEAATSQRKTQEARAKELRGRAAKAADGNEAANLAREVADLEAEIQEVPRLPQLWTSDATPERMGTLLADNAECMAWLSSESGIFDLLAGRYSNGIPNLDLILKSHAGDSERVDRGSRPPVFLAHPSLTIGLSPQPEALRGLAGKPGFRGRGLLARFLYFLPPSPLGYRKLTSKPIPCDVRAAYDAGVKAMLDWPQALDADGNEALHALTLAEDAYQEWHSFALTIESSMRPGGELESFTDWAGKAPGAAVRIAGVLHGIEHAHGDPWGHPITAQTMAQALNIMAVLLRHSVAALDLMGADSTIAAARHAWAWIERNRRSEFTVRDAQQALKGYFPRVSDLREALSVLQERNYIELIDPATDGVGRKPSPTITVRPDIAEGWA